MQLEPTRLTRLRQWTRRLQFCLQSYVTGGAPLRITVRCDMRLILSLVLSGMLFTLTSTGDGAEWSCQQAGISLQLPTEAEWEQIKGDSAPDMQRVIFQRVDKTAVVQFAFFEKYPAATNLDEAYTGRWEKRHYSNLEIRKVSSEIITFKGRVAYQVYDRPRQEDQRRRSVSIIWLSDDGRLCSIWATRYEGDPLLDPVIKKFVESVSVLPKATK